MRFDRSFPLLLALPLSLMLACGARVEVTATGGSGAASSGGSGGTGAGTPCEALGEVGCLGASSTCAPVYDDKCCPSCDPVGSCADCIDIQFHHCAPIDEACSGSPTCGQVPDWACNGGTADCNNVSPFGSITPCHMVAGCTAAFCALDADCTTDPVCHPVTADICTANCDTIAPPCDTGLVAETNGTCYTGYCVSADLCPL